MNLLYVILQEHGAESPNVFSLTQNVSLWTLIIFVVLLVILNKFAFPHILGYAAAREQRIQDAIDAAKRQREETEQLLAQQREELANARTQLGKLYGADYQLVLMKQPGGRTSVFLNLPWRSAPAA